MSLSWAGHVVAPFESAPEARATHTISRHVKDYDDDGLVITMPLWQFLNGISDYATYLKDNRRAYISLTVEGNEAFQFAAHSASKTPENLSPKSIHVSPRAGNLSNTWRRIIERGQQKELQPFLLTRGSNVVYGVMHPLI